MYEDLLMILRLRLGLSRKGAAIMSRLSWKEGNMESRVRLSRYPEKRWRWFPMLVLGLLLGAVSVVQVTAQTADPGWLRLTQFAEGAPTVEVLLDGEPIWSDVSWGWISDFTQVEAGAHQLSVAPSDEAATPVAIDPVEVNVEAGHRLTAVIIGQPDAQLVLEVIDDTEACPPERLAEGSCLILVHNIAGAPAMTGIDNGEILAENITYGEPTVAFVPSHNWDTNIIVAADDPDIHLFEIDTVEDGIGGFWEPNVVYLFGFMGHYPGQPFEDYGVQLKFYSPLNAADVMAGFSDLGLQPEPGRVMSFDTLLAAFEAAGLTEMLRGDASFTLFAPTDGAFANLTDGTLDALMADPEALRAILMNHIVEGDLSAEEVMGQGTITTMGGAELTITDGNANDSVFHINDSAEVEFLDYSVANGRIYPVWNTVLMPE